MQQSFFFLRGAVWNVLVKCIFSFRKGDKMIELWKNIPGIDGYQVSSCGRVRSVPRTINVLQGKLGNTKRIVPAKILHACPTWVYGRQHYVTVRLNGKTKNVHRLMALAFLGPPPFGPRSEVNHKDGNRHNNVLSNIEWCSKSMNEQHSQKLRANRLAHGVTKAEPPKKLKGKKNDY
jgi:hypothetical protein